MQAAIDNAKRKFDIDIPGEIIRIKSTLNIEENGLPSFWLITKKDKRKARTNEIRHQRNKENKEKIKKKINPEINCPMNYLYNLQIAKFRNSHPTIPFKEFFIDHEMDTSKRMARKIEELIEKYSLRLSNRECDNNSSWMEEDDDILLRNDFEQLISDIKAINISGKYVGLIAYLIKRAFKFSPGIKRKLGTLKSKTDKNKSLLIKVLYEVNKTAFLRCFREIIENG